MQNDLLFNPAIDAISAISTVNEKVQIRIKQRNTRCSITSVEKLPTSFDLVILLKKMRKAFHCSGSIQTSAEGNKFIQLTGDQRLFVKKFLLDNSLVEEENIIMHGF